MASTRALTRKGAALLKEPKLVTEMSLFHNWILWVRFMVLRYKKMFLHFLKATVDINYKVQWSERHWEAEGLSEAQQIVMESVI